MPLLVDDQTSTTLSIVIFLGSLLLSGMASAVLAERLDQVGTAWGLPASFIGLITALGADSPEIASAVTALAGGHHDLGRGVIFGSNIFNVAMLLGFSALTVGRIGIGRANVLFNGGAALLATLIVCLQAAGNIGSKGAGFGLAVVLVPYVAVSCLHPRQLSRLPLPSVVAAWLGDALTAAKRDERDEERAETAQGDIHLSWADKLSIMPMLAVVVATSIAMVATAELLGRRWGVSQSVIGTFVIATLTGLPNVVAALRLATKGRGATLSSEAFNSNTLNLVVGAYLPTLFVSLPALSTGGQISAATLAVITIIAVAIGAVRRGFGRWDGAMLMIGYAVYAAVLLLR